MQPLASKGLRISQLGKTPCLVELHSAFSRASLIGHNICAWISADTIGLPVVIILLYAPVPYSCYIEPCLSSMRPVLPR